MKKAAWGLVGLLVGVLIATSVPVGAHHATSARRLANRVERLENQMAVQRQKTYYMDREGFYNGIVIGSQVFSACAPDAPATWTTDGTTGEFTWINDCFGVGAASEVRALKSLSVQR